MGKHKPAIDLNLLKGISEHGSNWTKANRKDWATTDINAVLLKLTPISEQLIDAIDNEDEVSFLSVCATAGLPATLARRVWDATMGSLDPQAARPCW